MCAAVFGKPDIKYRISTSRRTQLSQTICVVYKMPFGDSSKDQTSLYGFDPISSQAEAEYLAASSIGTKVTLNLSQIFKPEDKGSLPLFPLVHHESWYFVSPEFTLTAPGQSFAFTLNSVATPVDTLKVYQIPAPASLTDAVKLQAIDLILADAFKVGDSGNLYFKYVSNQSEALWLGPLKPISVEAKEQYADGFLKVLNTKVQEKYPDTLFFSFETGGSGGAVYAEVLVKLSQDQGVFSESTKSKLILSYPELLTLGFSPASAFQISNENLLSVLQMAATSTDTDFNVIQKHGFIKVAQYILNGFLNVTGGHPILKSEQAKSLAKDILNSLKD